MSRIYDRLPLQVAQVLRDVDSWRSDVLNGRDECAVTQLRRLEQSADALYKWEGEQDDETRIVLPSDIDDVAFRTSRDLLRTAQRLDDKTVPRLRLINNKPKEPKKE